MEFLNGFYPALGTPLDIDGNLIEESYAKQIELMIDAKARGVLCMGSMGAEQALTTKTYRKYYIFYITFICLCLSIYYYLISPDAGRLPSRSCWFI